MTDTLETLHRYVSSYAEWIVILQTENRRLKWMLCLSISLTAVCVGMTLLRWML